MRKCLVRILKVLIITLAVSSNFGCEKHLPVKTIKTKTGEMVLIKEGWFAMGSKDGESDELPVHDVWVDSFLIDKYEVTQRQFVALTGKDPSHFKGPNNPVEQVSWGDAALYCNARSRAEGLSPCYDEQTGTCDFTTNGYRLPTEAEWEYACRAGESSHDYFFGHDDRELGRYAWFKKNSQGMPHPIGTKHPNLWGIYDMYGNVVEWCNDVYEPDYYRRSRDRNPHGSPDSLASRFVVRGGSWKSSADACRSAYRLGNLPGQIDGCIGYDHVGFRCVRKVAWAAGAGENFNGNKVMSKTGYVWNSIFLEHQVLYGHPEIPDRLVAIQNKLEEKGLLSELRRMEPASFGLEWIATVHDPEYIERARQAFGDGKTFLDTPDVPISAMSFEAAVAAVGAVLSAVDGVIGGTVDNAFCAVRPPGHHALRDQAMGFCIFNNVAVATSYIRERHKLQKVLIVDWDVHHGNGIQQIFYDDPGVLYFSIHRYPFYPGTGSEFERGRGQGLGYTINIPLPAGSGDLEYKKVFEQKLQPAALAFMPDFVLISAGFDAHYKDPLGGMKVTEEGFAELTRIVRRIAEECCEGRLVSVLEGGYDLEGLANSVVAHIEVLMNRRG